MKGKRHREISRGSKTTKLLVLAAVIVMGCWTVVGLIGWQLVRWLENNEAAMLADLEQTLGRTVTLGDRDIDLFPPSIEIRELVIGPDPERAEETSPALRLPRAEIRLGLLGTLASFGRRIEIEVFEIDGLEIDVVHHTDGTINWQRIVRRLKQARADRPEQADGGGWLRDVRLDRARLVDGRVRFVDVTSGSKPVEISRLRVELDDARLRGPFDAELSAAVLAAEENLRVSARFGRATDDGSAPLRSIEVNSDPIDLAPLAHFVRVAAGDWARTFEGGAVAADLRIELGESRGRMTTLERLEGTLSFDQLKFAGGEPFDAFVDGDVVADIDNGDIRIGKLEIVAGPMAVQARGELLALRERPTFRDFHLTGHRLDFDNLQRWYPELPTIVGARLNGPFSIEAHATDDGRQKFRARIDLSRARIIVPDRLRKPAGTPMLANVAGEVRGDDVAFDEIAVRIGDWRAIAGGTIANLEDRHPSFELSATIPPFAVPRVAALLPRASTGRLPTDLRVGATVRADGRLGRSETIRIHVPSFSARAGRSDLRGSFTVRDLDRPDVQADLSSSYLDLSDFRGGGSDEQAPTAGDRLARLDGRVKLSVARGRAARVSYANLKADLEFEDGLATARALEVQAFGGKFSGSGSRFSPFDRERSFSLVGRISTMGLEPLLREVAGVSGVLRGSLSAQLDLVAQGTTIEALKRTLTGTAVATIEEGTYLPLNLVGAIRSALARQADIPPLASLLTTRITLPSEQPLGRFQAKLSFEPGLVALDQPLVAATPFGKLDLTGNIGYDRSFSLTGTFTLTPATVTKLLANRLKFTESLPIALRIRGPLKTPTVTLANSAETVSVLARELVAHGLQQLPGPTGDLPTDLPTSPDEARQRLENEAREQLEDATRRRTRKLGDDLLRQLPRR